MLGARSVTPKRFDHHGNLTASLIKLHTASAEDSACCAEGYTCGHPKPPDPPPKESCRYKSELKCAEHVLNCTWCSSAAVGSACFTWDDAQKLPPSVFKCAGIGEA